MTSLEKFIQDIMSQKFLNSDATRLLMVEAMYKNGCFKNVYKRSEIRDYVFRSYSDNESAAGANPDDRVKNIHHYGLSDLNYLLDIALIEWNEYATNKSILWDDYYIYLNLSNDELINSVPIARKIIEMYKVKYFKFDILPPNEIEYTSCIEDENINVFGKGVFRNRVLEDMQYCPLCEETNINNLFAVHIVPSKYCNPEEMIDKNNGLLMCKGHAEDFIKHKFGFKENGFVYINEKCSVENKMHLCVTIKNPARRKYLKRAEFLFKIPICNQ